MNKHEIEQQIEQKRNELRELEAALEKQQKEVGKIQYMGFVYFSNSQSVQGEYHYATCSHGMIDERDFKPAGAIHLCQYGTKLGNCPGGFAFVYRTNHGVFAWHCGDHFSTGKNLYPAGIPFVEKYIQANMLTKKTLKTKELTESDVGRKFKVIEGSDCQDKRKAEEGFEHQFLDLYQDAQYRPERHGRFIGAISYGFGEHAMHAETLLERAD